VDFAPSILSIMGISSKGSMQGTDISRGMIEKAYADEMPDVAFIRSTGTAQDGRWIGAVNHRYKLILSAEDNPWLLDLEKDPNELINYIDQEETKSVVKELASSLMDYAGRYEDPFLDQTKMREDLNQLLTQASLN
jgi:arylsulfatase A-like enzyme